MLLLFLFLSDPLIVGGTVSIAFHKDILPFCLSLHMMWGTKCFCPGILICVFVDAPAEESQKQDLEIKP